MTRKFTRCAAVAACLAAAAFAGDTTWTSTTRFSGFTSFEFGQIYKGQYMSGPISHWWMERVRSRIQLSSSITDWSRLALGIECEYQTTFRHSSVGSEAADFYLNPSLHQAEGIVTLLKKAALSLELGIGYFPYKYNENVRNMGEYFFRMRPYPGWMDNQFDLSFARLIGSHLRFVYGEDERFLKITNDMIINSTTQTPMFDYSITDIARFELGKIATVGGGFSLNRIFPVDSTLTTPDGEIWTQDTNVHYTSKSTNILGFFSFDPKEIIPLDLLGKNDLIFYGEAAIMGLKNYPGRYDSLWQRIPIMGGFNFPAFKLLDVVAVEVEWWGNQWPNSLYQVYFNNGKPRPDGYNMGWDTLRQYKVNDNWKWSFYMRKSIKNIQIMAQAARDHIHGQYRSGVGMERDWDEVCGRPEYWYYMLKVQYNF